MNNCLKILFNETTIPGIEQIHNQTIVRFLKVLWIIALILSLAGLSYNTYKSYNKWYNEPDIGLTVKLKSSDKFPFPAVTVCSPTFPYQLQHIHPFTYIEDYLDFGTIPANFSSEIQNFLAISLQICGNYEYGEEGMAVCKNRTEKDIVKILHSGIYQNFFQHCKFRSLLTRGCELIFNQIFTDYGICYSYNMQGYKSIFNKDVLSTDFDDFQRKQILKFPYKLSKSSYDFIDEKTEEPVWSLYNGYTTKNDEVLPIRAERKNTVFFNFKYDMSAYPTGTMWFCKTHGRAFRVILHLPNEIPSPLHPKFSLPFNHDMRLSLSLKSYTTSKELQKYSLSKRRCYFEGEKKLKFFASYTKRNCDYECMTNYTLRKCGCVKFSMPRMQDTPVCDLDKMFCYSQAISEWPNKDDRKIDNSLMPCSCYPPCNDIHYDFTAEADTLIDDEFYDNQFLTFLTLQFSEHVVEEYESYVAYTFENFFADFGGLIGLFLGFSIFSCVKFFYNCVTVYLNIKRREIKKEVLDLNSVIYVQSQCEKPSLYY